MLIEEDKLVRKIADLERQIRELTPSIAKSMTSVVASIVNYGASGASAVNFDVSTTSTIVVSGEIDIPDGFTTAVVMNTSSAAAFNGGVSASYFYVRSWIDGVGGGETPTLASPGGGASATAAAIRTITGLMPGGTISVGVSVHTDVEWGTSASNIANLNAIALFSH